MIYTKFVSLISSSPVIQTLLPLSPSGEVRSCGQQGGAPRGAAVPVTAVQMCNTPPGHLLQSAAALLSAPHPLPPPSAPDPLRSATSTATAWMPLRTRCSSSPPVRASWSWRPRRWAVVASRLEPGWRAGQQAADSAAAAAQQGLSSIAVRLLLCKHRLPASAHGSPPPTAPTPPCAPAGAHRDRRL